MKLSRRNLNFLSQGWQSQMKNCLPLPRLWSSTPRTLQFYQTKEKTRVVSPKGNDLSKKRKDKEKVEIIDKRGNLRLRPEIGPDIHPRVTDLSPTRLLQVNHWPKLDNSPFCIAHFYFIFFLLDIHLRVKGLSPARILQGRLSSSFEMERMKLITDRDLTCAFLFCTFLFNFFF